MIPYRGIAGGVGPMTSSLSLSTLVVRSPDIIATDMDGETVMMSIEQGQYYGLSGIGPFLWDQLAEPLSIEELCRRAMQAYDVDEATCQADMLAFIGDLLENGALRHAG
jgi:Coenzyme PQQ synthesis protein D (PqqD)